MEGLKRVKVSDKVYNPPPVHHYPNLHGVERHLNKSLISHLLALLHNQQHLDSGDPVLFPIFIWAYT